MASITGPLTGLINNIQESISGLVGEITGRTVDPNVPSTPTGKAFDAVTRTIEPGNWSKLTFPYTFSVVDILGSASPLAENPFTDFSLPIAPSEISQSLTPAISIKPTQGGTTVTHSGIRYNTLSIKGTTGINPFRGSGGVSRSTGEAIFQPKSLKYRSGYEVFHRFENWIRSYYEYKKVQGKLAQGLRLVFKNYKDGEFSIVEVLDFTMNRQAARPFLYDYDMQLKVIAQLNFTELTNNTTDFEQALDEALNFIDSARGVFLRSQGILRQIESTYTSVVIEPMRKVALAIKAAQGVGLVAADVGSRIVKNTMNAADSLAVLLSVDSQFQAAKTEGGLDPRLESVSLPNDLSAAASSQGSAVLDTLGEGLMAIDASELPESTNDAARIAQQEAAASPRSFYEDTITDLRRVKSNAEDFFNLGSSEYDSIFGRTATLSADLAKAPTQEELDLLNAFNDAIIGVSLLLSTENLFKSSFDERIQDMVQRFDGAIALFASTAVKQTTFGKSDTLERLAQRELGDSSRWGEIVEVNNLRPPYTTEDLTDTRVDILKPGDTVLIPVPAQNGFSQVPNVKQNELNKNLSELEKSLGTDLKLTSDNDLAITRSGDLELVAGPQNMAQAVILKLGYEPGEIIRYPLLGAGVRPGVKFPNLEDIKDGLVNTLLQDVRIQTIENLSIRRESSALYLQFDLKIKQVDIPIPISIQI